MNEDKQSPLEEEQAPKKAKKQEKRKRYQRKPDPKQDEIIKKQSALLERWLYLEQKSSFHYQKKPIWLDEHTPVVQLKAISRSTGALAGTLIELNLEEGELLLQVGEHSVTLKLPKVPRIRRAIDEQKKLVGQQVDCTIWPTRGPQRGKVQFGYDFFKLGGVRPLGKKTPRNIVDIVARLTNVWEEGFELKLWSPQRRHFFYTYVVGAYPYPDEKGEFVWVKGHFNLDRRVIELESAQAIAFVSDEELPAIKLLLNQKKQQKLQKTQQNPTKEEP